VKKRTTRRKVLRECWGEEVEILPDGSIGVPSRPLPDAEAPADLEWFLQQCEEAEAEDDAEWRVEVERLERWWKQEPENGEPSPRELVLKLCRGNLRGLPSFDDDPHPRSADFRERQGVGVVADAVHNVFTKLLYQVRINRADSCPAPWRWEFDDNDQRVKQLYPYISLASGEPIMEPRKWLTTVTENVCADFRKRYRREKPSDLEDDSTAGASESADAGVHRTRHGSEFNAAMFSAPGGNAFKTVLDRERLQILRNEILKLTPKLRAPLLLCDAVSFFKPAEIARILNLSDVPKTCMTEAAAAALLGWKQGTLSANRSRAREVLRRVLANKGNKA
jgi:hypothetical protein